MPKIIRNTLFTLVVVSLTAVGLHWNKLVNNTSSIVRLGQTVLAGQTIAATLPDFPLRFDFNSPQVRLGQAEVVSITTVPNATLDIITQYPDGSINHPETRKATADQSGNYSFSVTINDFHNLGAFRLSVVATAGSKTTETIGQFAVTPWEVPTSSQTGGYSYPLVP